MTGLPGDDRRHGRHVGTWEPRRRCQVDDRIARAIGIVGMIGTMDTGGMETANTAATVENALTWKACFLGVKVSAECKKSEDELQILAEIRVFHHELRFALTYSETPILCI